ncbi:hypothetical protein EDB85DRAFT_1892240 [Lactarius pseudohatsudake]|nr:hypothetical protein EDB85DRAFT_1892240 [Lactarius pseudohatsudake]
MTTRRRHHRRPRRRHRRSCLRAVPRRRITIVPASVLFPPPHHRRCWCRSGGGCAPCGGGVATALACCEGWRWRRTRAWRWVGSGGHGLCTGKGRRPRGLRGRSPAAAGGVAVALRRLLRAVRGGGGGELVRGDGLEAAATGCVLESGGGGSHGDLGAEAQQRREVWGPRDRAWWCGGLRARNVVPGVEGVAGVQRQYLEEDH